MNKHSETLSIVGIGASAGGLKALKEFFSNLPKDTGLSYIVVQHIAPDHDSLLAELLARATGISVVQAKHKQRLQANHVYVIPPDTYIEVKDQHIQLVKLPDQQRMAIDHLFRSMADTFHSKTIGILFSGSGSDGTAGMRTIKATGGLTIAQTPDEAEYASMPQSAIDAGVVDIVACAQDMPQQLVQYLLHPYLRIEPLPQNSQQQNFQQDIATIFRDTKLFDLQQYKESTVTRRIYRRMSLTGNLSPTEYLQHLSADESERQQLMRDLMINVTDFFRDKPAFELLQKEVVEHIVAEHEAGSTIRIWVAGCASGEEAYSIAILFLEQIEQTGKELELTIFATDIDDDAIKIARRGVYPASIMSELTANYAKKYFTRNESGRYSVKPVLRSKISFAKHNVFADPPFSNMALISCRNLLIYLKKSAQQKVLKAFHFALSKGDFLFLGSSENLGEQSILFTTISTKWRLYQRNHNDGSNIFMLPGQTYSSPVSNRKLATQPPKETMNNSEKQMQTYLLRTIAPSVLLNANNQIMFIHGDVSSFIKLTAGAANLDFINLLVPTLRTRIRSGLFSARRNRQRTATSLPLEFCDALPDKCAFQAVISPISQDNTEDESVIVTFEKRAVDIDSTNLNKVGSEHTDQDHMIEQMERELRYLRQELQSTVEELETSTEELRASHEESLSTNEELQSSNEELEASTEELRSLNEELTIVNKQLKENIKELSTSHNDIKNFFASTNLATVFLSADLKIKRFTPAAERLLRMASQDIDKSIDDLSQVLLDENILAESQQVFDSLEPSEQEIANHDGRWFNRRILPYLTEDRRIDGVVITFHDTTSRKLSLQRLEISSQQQAVIAKLGMEALRGDDVDNLMDQTVREVAYTLNADYCAALKYDPAQNNLLMVSGVGWDSGSVGKALISDEVNSQSGFTLKSHGTVIVDDFAAEQRFARSDILIKHKVVSSISCTISHQENPYGVLSVYTKTKRIFSEDDANFLVAAANIISVAIHRKYSEGLLRENEHRLRIAKDSNDMGAFEYDIDSGALYWDDKLSEYWGVDAHEVVTLDKFYAALHPDDVKATRTVFDHAFAPGGSGHYHTVYRVINPKSKKLNWIEASGQVVVHANKPVKMFGMVICVTKQKEMEQTLFKAVNKLEKASQKKNEFLATLGHELRNPIAAINSGIQLLQNDFNEADWALNMMNNNVHLVSSLLDSLLDITRISRGQILLKKRPLDMVELLSDLQQSFSGPLAAKHQTLTVKLPDHNIVTMADKVRLEQVFFNLLQNASKFTADGGELALRLTHVGDEIQVELQDSGIGISPSKHKIIFEPFEQLSPPHSATTNGLGIGLSIVKKFVKLHRGRVTVQSDVNSTGSLFTVFLPMQPCQPAALEHASQVKANTSLRKNLRVLLVDDNQDAAIGLETILQMKGCVVMSAFNGKDALAACNNFMPDAFILDIGLPDMTGFELLKLLTANYPHKTVNIALTGYGHEEAKKESKRAGFKFHLNKPADLSKLLAALATA